MNVFLHTHIHTHKLQGGRDVDLLTATSSASNTVPGIE